jgi:hypothetical protein
MHSNSYSKLFSVLLGKADISCFCLKNRWNNYCINNNFLFWLFDNEKFLDIFFYSRLNFLGQSEFKNALQEYWWLNKNTNQSLKMLYENINGWTKTYKIKHGLINDIFIILFIKIILLSYFFRSIFFQISSFNDINIEN